MERYDAELIAHAPEDIRYLLNALREVLAMIADGEVLTRNADSVLLSLGVSPDFYAEAQAAAALPGESART